MKATRTIPELIRTRNVLIRTFVVMCMSIPATAQEVGTFTWGEHPSLQFGDLVRIDFRARIHSEMRGSTVPLDDSDTSGLDLARRRVGISGEIGELAEFQIERELVDGEGWRDLYVNFRQLRRIQVQAGQFKMPFGLDENTSSSNLDFVYRSRAATHLAPGRDRGVMAHGRLGKVRYAWGAFANDGDSPRGISSPPSADGIATAGRLTVQPFRSSKSMFEDFQAGIAYTMSDVPASIVNFRGETPLGQSFVRSTLALQGARRRIGVEARWRPGPFSVQSEFSRVTSERLEQSIAETDLPAVTGSAWYVQGSWIVTGEHKRNGASEPKRPLFDGGFGAIELAARIEGIRFESFGAGQPSSGPRAETIPLQGDGVVTLGVNWWLNRWIKVQANIIRDTISAPVGEALAPPPAYWSRVVRIGFSL